MDCVVCERSISAGQEQYANAWEKTRKQLPCCGAGCLAAFDPDLHWIPAMLPPLATGDEKIELRTLANRRLRGLDEARPVVRELLLVGLDVATLRDQIAFSGAGTRAVQRTAFVRSLMSLLTSISFGRFFLHEARDQRSKRSYAAAHQDLDQWERAEARRQRRQSGVGPAQP